MSDLKIHHIALKTKNVESLSDFYSTVLGLEERDRHFFPSGELRSVWFRLGHSILMIEHLEADSAKKTSSAESDLPGWHLLSLTIPSTRRKEWKSKLEKQGIAIQKESDFSLYFLDPEGNRLALTSDEV